MKNTIAGIFVRCGWAAAVLLVLVLGWASVPAQASKVLVLVNDRPVTDFDVSQRMKLNGIIGGRRDRKSALRSQINAAVLETEARKLGIVIPDTQVDKTLRAMARNMGGMAKMKATLRKRGVRLRTMKDYIRSTLLFRVMMQRMGKKLQVKVDQKAIDRKYRQILNDPRLRPITIYNLRQVTLPVENVAPAMRQQLLYARMVEARQIMKRYKGCRSLRKAVSGIFNVKVSKPLQADPRRMMKQLRKAIQLAGTRRLIGPIRSTSGIQLIAFCGSRKIVPPRPKREQIAAIVKNEAMGQEIERIMRQLRKKAYIEYKDKSAAIR